MKMLTSFFAASFHGRRLRDKTVQGIYKSPFPGASVPPMNSTVSSASSPNSVTLAWSSAWALGWTLQRYREIVKGH